MLRLPSGLVLLMPDVVVLGTPSEKGYRATPDDGSVKGDMALPGVMVTQASGVCGTMAVSCEPELVEIHTVLG